MITLTVQTGVPFGCESNRDQYRSRSGVKRAILPAAISESAAKVRGSRSRPEVESSHRGDEVASRKAEIDDRLEQNSAYSLSIYKLWCL